MMTLLIIATHPPTPRPEEEEGEGIEQLDRIIMSFSPRPSYCAIEYAFRDWGNRERRDNTIFPLDYVALNRITSSYVRKKKKKERRFNYCLSESGKKKERKKAPWDRFDIKQKLMISLDIFFPPSVGRPVANVKSSRKMKTRRRGDEGSWTSFEHLLTVEERRKEDTYTTDVRDSFMLGRSINARRSPFLLLFFFFFFSFLLVPIKITANKSNDKRTPGDDDATLPIPKRRVLLLDEDTDSGNVITEWTCCRRHVSIQ